MHPQKLNLLWMNLIGGIAVLGSYAHGLITHPASRERLWGDVPAGLQPLYLVSMILAATGYFAFSYFLFFRVDAENTRILGKFGYGWLCVLYALILVPSALWMPLTFSMLVIPNIGLWIAIRLTLAVVGLASVTLLFAVATVRPRPPGPAYGVAILGAAAFCVQTAVLDALVWAAYFPH